MSDLPRNGNSTDLIGFGVMGIWVQVQRWDLNPNPHTSVPFPSSHDASIGS